MVANVLGIGIGYAITIILARHLPTDGFEQYIGTVATLGLLASLGEAGFGKYALKILPVYMNHGWSHLIAGYLRFAFLGCLAFSLVLGVVAAAIEIPMRAGVAERIVLIAIVFLPAMAGVGVAVDVLLALRLAVTATVIARLLIPMTTLGLLVVLTRAETLTPYYAVVCFSLSSLLGLMLATLLVWFRSRPLVVGVRAETKLSEWTLQGLSFLLFGFLSSWIFKATLVLAHHLPHEAHELALLAPAFETGCLILLLSKSTDKYFQPTMSVIIDSSDWALGNALRRRRHWIVGSGVAAYLLVVFLFGKSILGLYGADFVQAFPALCLIALGSSFWTMFSLAPSFLLFAGEKRGLLVNLLANGILLIVLTVVLFHFYGVLGAAAAYMIAIGSLTLVNISMASQRLGQMRGAQPT